MFGVGSQFSQTGDCETMIDFAERFSVNVLGLLRNVAVFAVGVAIPSLKSRLD
jgi:hypothetical protein